MKKIEKKKSLSLATETVRALEGHELKAAVGGNSLANTLCILCPVSGTPNHCIS